jgi:uroporphyrinogen-III synthase
VGPSTAEELARHGIKADLIPTEHTGEALVTALGRGTGRVLLPRVAGAPEKLVEQLKSNGWKCEVVVAYVNLPATDDSFEAEQLRRGEFDIVTFASPSAVRGFISLVGAPEDLALTTDAAGDKFVACIGPSTAEAAGDAGFDVAVVAEEHTADGLVRALTEAMPRPAADGDATIWP